MLDEKIIKDKIVRKLQKDFRNYGVEDFPLDVMRYSPQNIVGELLIKSLGTRPTQYLDRNLQINPVSFGNFIVFEYQWRITIINKDFKSQNEIFSITTALVNSMQAVDFSNIEGASRFMPIDISEPLYNEEQMFQYRSLTFTLPVITYIGD